MKLAELNPRWFAEAGRHGQGVTFDCPSCREGRCKGPLTRLAVAFQPTLDGGPPLHLGKLLPMLKAIANGEGPKPGVEPGFPGDVVPPGIHWQRTGESFDLLTLQPSVDASRSGHWHGWIRNGEAITA